MFTKRSYILCLSMCDLVDTRRKRVNIAINPNLGGVGGGNFTPHPVGLLLKI